jgi:hypothetical protein
MSDFHINVYMLTACAKITSTEEDTSEEVNDTRWSSRAYATLVLKEGCDEIKNALLDIAVAKNEVPLS